MNLSSELRTEFYRWEQIGRGETQWAIPVIPEPVYVPFIRGMDLQPARIEDTGEVPGLLEKASSFFKKRQKAEAPLTLLDQLFEPFVHDIPPKHVHEPRLDHIEIVLYPPEDASISLKEFGYFLNLLNLKAPATFELIGGHEFQLCTLIVHVDEATHVLSLLQTCLPDVGYRIGEDEEFLHMYLSDFTKHHLVSRDLALENEFFYPIALPQNSSTDPYTALFAALAEVQQNELSLIQISFSECTYP